LRCITARAACGEGDLLGGVVDQGRSADAPIEVLPENVLRDQHAGFTKATACAS